VKKNPDRYIICGRSPTSGKLMFYTQAQSFATRGRSKKFASVEKAWARARKLLTEHPQLRAYNLFADKLRATDVTGTHKVLKNPSRVMTHILRAGSGYDTRTGGFGRVKSDTEVCIAPGEHARPNHSIVYDVTGERMHVKNSFLIKKNPSGYAKIREQYAAEIDRADAKLSGFSGHRATHSQVFKAKPFKVGFALGDLVAVEYRAKRDGETDIYRHQFKKSSQPLLSVSDDGKQLAILGGEFRVTERGIEDQ
jgi:hypothetical protein